MMLKRLLALAGALCAAAPPAVPWIARPARVEYDGDC